jgi:hypothetical protein
LLKLLQPLAQCVQLYFGFVGDFALALLGALGGERFLCFGKNVKGNGAELAFGDFVFVDLGCDIIVLALPLLVV